MPCKNLDTLTTTFSQREGNQFDIFYFQGTCSWLFYHCCLYNFVNYSFSVILKIPPRIYIKLSVYISELNSALFLLKQSKFSLFFPLTVISLYYTRIYPLHNRTLELVYTCPHSQSTLNYYRRLNLGHYLPLVTFFPLILLSYLHGSSRLLTKTILKYSIIHFLYTPFVF